MAIRDLLWACPFCAVVSALCNNGKSERCVRCGASFRRGRGARILATHPDGMCEDRPAAEWLDRLPPLPPVPEGSIGPEPVLVRRSVGIIRVRMKGEYLGRVERLGQRRPAALILEPDAIHLRGPRGRVVELRLEELAAIQPSSTSLQLRPRNDALIALSFPESSVLLWEHWLQAATRRRYARLGRPPITEFQPEIR